MIKITNDINAIAEIWQEAFGDSYDDIKYFDNSLKNGKCIGYYLKDELVSMLYLIDCNLNDKKYYYVYAACTLDKHKNCGYMSSLLDYCIKQYKSICLIPANEGLVNYYSKRGLINKHSQNCISFFESKSLINDYLFEGCELKTPIIMSN